MLASSRGASVSPSQDSAALPAQAGRLRGRIATQSATYLAGNVVRAALPFLLIPFLTHRLTPADYGVVAIYQTLILFIAPFVPFNVNAAVTVEYFKTNRSEFATYLTSSMAPPAAIFVAATLLFPVMPAAVLQRLSIPRTWLMLLPLFGLTQLLPNLALAVYQVEQKAIRFGIFSVGMSALNVLLTILFVGPLGWGWRGRLNAVLFSQIAFTGVSFLVLKNARLLKKTVSWTSVRDITRYCAPLIPHSIGGTATDIGDRIIVGAILGAAAAGEYSVAAQIGQILSVFVSSINQAWAPFLYRELATIDARRKRDIVYSTYGIAAVMVFAYLGLVLIAAPLAGMVVDPRYRASLGLVRWFALGYLFNGFYYLVGNYIFFAKQTRVLALITFANAVFSVVITWLGVRRFGMVGAAWASALSWATFFVITAVFAQRVFPMPWFSGRLSAELPEVPETS